MKKTLFIVLSSFLSYTSWAQVSPKSAAKPDSHKKLMTVEASCGECSFGLDGNSCDLAVKIDGKAYFVEGPTIHDYGHPHNKDGFCLAVRKAEVQGEIVENRFKASYFKLLPVAQEKTDKHNKK